MAYSLKESGNLDYLTSFVVIYFFLFCGPLPQNNVIASVSLTGCWSNDLFCLVVGKFVCKQETRLYMRIFGSSVVTLGSEIMNIKSNLNSF